MKISNKANEIVPSLTRKLFNMAQDYNDVIDLTLGDPDLAAPEEIKEAAITSIRNNLTHYSANAGLLQAREVIAERVKKIWGVECDSDNVMLTIGGMEALYVSLLCMIDEGDEVIIFAPYYVNYVQMVTMCGGTPVIIDAYGENGFVITKEEILEKVTSKTVAIIINSPNNPTGDVLNNDFLRAVYETACEKDLAIISDEVYRTLLYDGKKHMSILQFPNANERTILIDSMSKEYSMTGWRIGFAKAPEQFVKAMMKVQENIAACAPLPSQYAMLHAYKNDVDNGYLVKEFEERRNFLCENISKIKKISCVKPKGTFYMFVNIAETGMKSENFAELLLKEKHVAVVPGKAYGDNYDDYIRIAFTKKIDVLGEAISRISDFVSRM